MKPPRATDTPPDAEAAIAAMPDEPAPPAGPSPRPWALMDDAPRDGTIIETKEDPEDPDYKVRHAVWRTTRTRGGHRWLIVSFWADPLSRQKLWPEPFCWRLLEGNVLPSAVMGQM